MCLLSFSSLTRVAGILPLEIDLVLFHIRVVDVLRRHPENHGGGHEKVKEVHDLHARVLRVELLVLGPPFPRHAVGQLGDLLRHRAAVIEEPLLALFIRHRGAVHADPLVEKFLLLEHILEHIELCHDGSFELACGRIDARTRTVN